MHTLATLVGFFPDLYPSPTCPSYSTDANLMNLFSLGVSLLFSLSGLSGRLEGKEGIERERKKNCCWHLLNPPMKSEGEKKECQYEQAREEEYSRTPI